MDRFVCIHGHFYQPPRENAWLEAIELQDSAYPYHDWNERITAECYAPNADSRILDERDRIVRIVNNYGGISFNFGPTLLAWLERSAPDTYAKVIEGDRLSRVRFSGHGSALAQAFHHTILPLSSARDRRTQVLWGVRDFLHRFGREPEGMWLPETAVDVATLEDLAESGIAFTILAPHQASAVRPLRGGDWRDVSNGSIDTTRPYLCRLPSGRSICLFFYDGPVSRAVAFEGMLRNGERFASRVLDGIRHGDGPRLAHIATDGETYGHHHRHGEMALAYALHHIQEEGLATITNYGEFLDRHPPTDEVRILENTSWSCAHGVERWRSDCGCHTGGEAGWHQRWRGPLRSALDWLRDHLEPAFEEAAGRLVRDPWEARDDYVDVLLDRSPERLAAFLARHATTEPTDANRIAILKLLEMQRHAMLMYTSCGWFFNEVSGIETVQVLQYAARAIQLTEELFGQPLEEQFLTLLEEAPSNDPAFGNARRLYEAKVKPAKVDLMHVAAHYAVSSIFARFEKEERVFCYRVRLEEHQSHESGGARLSVGRATVESEVTGESLTATFALLHFGGHNLSGGIRRFLDADAYDALIRKLLDAFREGDLAAVIHLLASFPEYTFSLRSLFADRQREILYHTLDESLRRAEAAYRRLYEENTGVMRYLIELGLPLPRAFATAAEFVLNRELRAVFSSDSPDLVRAERLLEQAMQTQITLDRSGLGYAVRRTLERLAEGVLLAPYDLEPLQRLASFSRLAVDLPFPVDLWKAQNLFYQAVHKRYPAPALPAPRSVNGAGPDADDTADAGELAPAGGFRATHAGSTTAATAHAPDAWTVESAGPVAAAGGTDAAAEARAADREHMHESRIGPAADTAAPVPTSDTEPTWRQLAREVGARLSVAVP
jgi:alpha-amylase/alpha-mannosidase (GH57 family)